MLSNESIQEIGAIHPRFACTLANQNNFGFHVGTSRVYWTPVPIGTADVNAFLHRSQNGSFFAAFSKSARRLNDLIEEGKLDRVEYRITVEVLSKDGISIRLDVARGSEIDPPYKKLLIKIARIPGSSRETGPVKPTEWSIE